MNKQPYYTRDDFERLVQIPMMVTASLGQSKMDVTNPLWIMQNNVAELCQHVAHLQETVDALTAKLSATQQPVSETTQ